MVNKIFALLMVCAFAFNAADVVFAADTKRAAKRQTNQLAARLPASDAVVSINIKRLFADALPQILSGSESQLAAIVGKIDEIKSKTNFDLRQFEQVAVGISIRQTTAQELDFQPVIFARGASMNANALLALGKTAANGKYREEKSGARSIYVFSPRELMPQKSSPSNDAPAPVSKKTPSAFERAMDKMIEDLSREVAVTALDDNTLAIGTPARVRESVGASPARVGADVLNLINRRTDAVVAVAAKLSNGVSAFLPDLDNDEIGKNLDAIRYLAASFNVGDGGAAVSVLAKTVGLEQAKSLFEQIEGLQSLGKMFVGGSSKGADKKALARMIENVKIARAANEVTLDLQIPQSDINILIGKKK